MRTLINRRWSPGTFISHFVSGTPRLSSARIVSNLLLEPTVRPRPSVAQQGNLLLFETTSEGLLALPLSSVHSVRSALMKTTYQQPVDKNCLSINYQNSSRHNQPGLIKYLSFGLTWVPTYEWDHRCLRRSSSLSRFSLVLLASGNPREKKLRLTSKAVILNDIENMRVGHLFCIVGFQHTNKFVSITDPLVSTDSVERFLGKWKQSENSPTIDSFNQLPYNVPPPPLAAYSAEPMGGFGGLASFASLGSVGSANYPVPALPQSDTDADDLHLYEFKDVLLQKKERLMLPIFDLELPYRDVYHCHIDGLQLSNMHSGFNEKKDHEEVRFFSSGSSISFLFLRRFGTVSSSRIARTSSGQQHRWWWVEVWTNNSSSDKTRSSTQRKDRQRSSIWRRLSMFACNLMKQQSTVNRRDSAFHASIIKLIRSEENWPSRITNQKELLSCWVFLC